MPVSQGTQCCAYGCKKRKKKDLRSDSEGSSDNESSRKRDFPRTFHLFPSDPERKNLWLQEIHRKDWKPSKHSVLCSDHFLERDIDRTGQIVRLRKDAIPLRFKKFPKHLRKEIKLQLPTHKTIEEDVTPSTSKEIIMCDHTYSCQESSRRELIQSQKRNSNLAARLKTANQRARRLKKKVTSLKMIINDLRSKTVKKLHSLECEDA